MLGGRKWRKVGILVLALCVLVAACGWLGPRLAGEEAYQRRLARWGGRSREVPQDSPLLRPYRRYLGDRVYRALAGSSGRVVDMTAGSADATSAQLAELLEAQPIRRAWLDGSKHLGDDWIAGIKEPGIMSGLMLNETKVTDRSAEVILKMYNLTGLSLVDTAISDAAVARLCRLPKLDSLSVGGPNIRSIRLVDHRLLDESGAPAARAEGKLRLEGLVEITGLPGATHNIRVEIRRDGNPLTETTPKQELSLIELESPWSWRFRIDLAGIPPGRSSVEVWIDHQPGITTPIVQYRMKPFTIELAAPEASEGPGSTGP
jgi:hypothetical protein